MFLENVSYIDCQKVDDYEHLSSYKKKKKKQEEIAAFVFHSNQETFLSTRIINSVLREKLLSIKTETLKSRKYDESL